MMIKLKNINKEIKINNKIKLNLNFHMKMNTLNNI